MLALRPASVLAFLVLALGVAAQDPNADSTDTGSTDTGSTGGDTGNTSGDTTTDGSGMEPSASPGATATDTAPLPSAAVPSGSATTNGTTTGNGTVSSGDPNWNSTYFYMPDRRRDGYWVNGIANVAAWRPVPDPADIILVHSTNPNFGQKVVYQNIPGGVQNVNVTINDIPVGSGYVVWLVEAGTNIKLGQSYGFTIKPAGTEQGSTATTPFAVPSFNPNPNGEANGAGGSAATNGAIVAAAKMIAPSAVGIGAGALLGFVAAMSAM
ncbi:hypothetical protein CspeluHIS016_0101490 [Cutaneotrichosporon spelunceum]|uniref:Uncharacterized protein n=1 Tax=Cutaneotrichosporon spelunceum TaxID=1672016 RepID=A0AAD3TLZ8_9TREE|nr:hypothetical protein CspeluHIS016_0101490 [Cutaneotrichosporon spelunceum]